MSSHLMSSHVISCHVISCHLISSSHLIISSHLIASHRIASHLISHLMSSHRISPHLTSFRECTRLKSHSPTGLRDQPSIHRSGGLAGGLPVDWEQMRPSTHKPRARMLPIPICYMSRPSITPTMVFTGKNGFRPGCVITVQL